MRSPEENPPHAMLRDDVGTPNGTPTPSRLSAVMDGLVSDARSARDGVFNTLDAVDRQTKLAGASLARQVQRFFAEQAAAARAQQAAAQESRDARFDPEDEWDVQAPAASTGDPGHASGRNAADDPDDADNYPETWLR